MFLLSKRKNWESLKFFEILAINLGLVVPKSSYLCTSINGCIRMRAKKWRYLHCYENKAGLRIFYLIYHGARENLLLPKNHCSVFLFEKLLINGIYSLH